MSKRKNRAKAVQRPNLGPATAAANGSSSPPPPSVCPVVESPTNGEPLCGLKEDVYRDERKLLVDLEQKSADQHDKAILMLAAGGLALSITFLEKIAPKPVPETLWLVAVSWGSFILSLCTILASFLTSQWACSEHRDILDRKFLNQDAGATDDFRWARRTSRLTIASYGCFLLAVLTFAIFSWLNIPKGGT